MNDTLILASVFMAIVIAVFALMNFLVSRRDVHRNIDAVSAAQAVQDFDPEQIFSDDNDGIAFFFEVQNRADPESLEARLIRAGFFSRDGRRTYNLIRLLVSFSAFLLVWFLVDRLSPTTPQIAKLFFSAMASGVSFILCNIFLDRMIQNQQLRMRRLFPDLLDLLVVCVDAGMSIEAAIDRVAREFLQTQPVFGIHLAIVSLEVRAGRPLHEALNNLASRINLDEARTMAVLFRQSQELGASIIKTLRVYSQEMRQMRLLRAEEKANVLPVKMLLPLAAFLFPVNLVMVLVPSLMRIVEMLTTMTPGG